MNLEGVLVEDRKSDTLLYAGTVQVLITDWFFLTNKAELKYIGLQDAIINFNRTDSIWNYAYLNDYFAAPKTNKKKKSGIEFNLKKVVMQNVSFVQKDAWVGQDMYIKLAALDLDANEITITEKNIDANHLHLVAPFFHQYAYTGRKPLAPKLIKTINSETVIVDTTLKWNPDNWNMRIAEVSITKGTYRNDIKELASTLNYFDSRHIHFNDINASIKNLNWLSDTLTAAIDLKAKERSGLVVQMLKSSVRMHPQIMEFKNLYLKTNRSVLSNYFAMRYTDISDMSDFIHAVNMVGDFHQASISSDDLAFFAPEVKNWKRTLFIDGKIRGTVDALTGQNVTLRAGANTSLSGDFSLVGLPDINKTFINVQADELRTNYADAVTFAPALRKVTTPNLQGLGAVKFNGSFTGFINDFVTYGTIQTALGTVKSDLNMKLPSIGEPSYSGTIATDNFELGKLLNNGKLGVIALNTKIKGRSFDWDALDLTVDGQIRKFHYDKYTYQNITAKGRLNKKVFTGDMVIKDPNADLSLHGSITFSGTTPAFDLDADIVKAHLKALQLTEDDLSLSGRIKLAFKGNTIGDFLGAANLSMVTFTKGEKKITLESFDISSTYENGVRKIKASSTQFDAIVTGQFDLKSLPDAFTLFLNRYYPSYIKPPRRKIPNQNFTFDITTGLVEDYVQLIDKRLSGFNNSHITGALDVASNTLILNADVPVFGFNQYSFADVKLNGTGNFQRLALTGQVNNAVISDSLSFPQTTFTINAQNDISDITIATTANQTINQANLSAQIKTFSNGATVLFNPSSFVLNGKTWSIEQGGELDFRAQSMVQGQLVLRESTQEIRISTEPSDVGTWNDLHIALKNLNIGDLSPFFVKTNRIEGLLTGEIQVEDPKNRFNVISNIRTDQLRVDDDSIGQVKASIFYNNKTGLLTGNGSNVDPEHQIKFDLAIDLKDSANLHIDRISVKPVNYPVKILERFIGTLFSDLQGYLTGNLDILGEGASRDYVGKARLTDGGLKVNFTQVFYKIENADIELKENELDLGTLKLIDSKGNTATVRGTIGHNSWQNMVFDITAEVDDRPMQLLNTGYNDNQQFYGRAFGTGSLVLVGPLYDMNMYIEIQPSLKDSSFITLPPARSRESGQASFMVERKYGREMNTEDLRGSGSNITYEVNMSANPMVSIEVILDELTGDVIKGRGVGNLRMRAGTSEPLSMRGRFDIQEGSYLFTFQSFFKKPFQLRPNGNNFIEWTGDPYTAQIQFDAVYRAENVSFTPLASSLSLNDQIKNYRGDVNVVALLSGELFKPTFTFKLEFPENSAAFTDPTLAFGIQQIEKNANELNKQVTYLIVFNSFAPYESTSSYNPLNEFAYSTISGLFFGEINKRLNQLLSKILKNNELTFNFTGSLYNRNPIDQSSKGFKINQTDFNVSFGRSFLNERAQILVGGTLDVPIESDLEQSIRLFPDVSLELLINKSGTLRATFFYSQNPDFVFGSAQASGRNQKAGAKLSYRKEFPSLANIFLGRPKGKRKDTIPMKTSVDSASTVQENKK